MGLWIFVLEHFLAFCRSKLSSSFKKLLRFKQIELSQCESTTSNAFKTYNKIKNINKYVYIIGIPIIITIILLIIKPAFLTKKVKDEKSEKEHKVIDYTRVLIVLIIMLALSFGTDYLIAKKFKKSVTSSS